mmetsp:Transcript_15846/g.33498  ORF Transcript_15846/g.33498 Transcript_15846/m.33498 type:complete len:943 (+) Transcript_15846:386-3214(+)
MLSPSKKLLYLMALMPSSAQAAKEYSVTKTFKFKEDIFLKFHPLLTAIGPQGSADALMSALDDFADEFKQVWIEQIEQNLLDGGCEVEEMRKPKFELCEWKYPDRYDVDELPTPGQCYAYEDGFVQRIYYKIDKLEITCPEDFSYDDLDKAAYAEAAFADQDFLNIINPPDSGCDGNALEECLFSSAETVEWVEGYEVCNAELYINRFVDVPVYLKCLDTDGYGRKIANKLIKALDKYFEMEVSVVLTEKIMEQAPEGHVYNLASPYASDRKYCAHGAYYAGGNLVNQIPGDDGILITKFTYGFDVIWFKPRDFDDELLPDIEYTINDIFNDGDFLEFLEEEYPDYDFIQDVEVCEVVGPDEVTFPPTEEPTYQPTEGPICDVDTNDGCTEGQVCRLSCVWQSSEPQCFPDDEERDCTDKYGPGYICLDTNGDGVIDGSDHSEGCVYAAPTKAPSEMPTDSPTIPIIITSSPTLLPTTETPTISPSRSPVTPSPTISYPPSMNLEPSASPSNTSFPTSEPTPIPTTRLPTENPTTESPTIAPTSGETETEETESSVYPTPLQIRPAESRSPTTSPNESYPSPSSPSPTCPKCIIHPDDTEEDECPIATTGTCSNGNRGDGICPFEGHCCSKWGYCGTTAEYCDDDSIAPTPSNVEGAPSAPTYSVDAGQCALGDVGDGFCPDESHCCSDWGYCGAGENYCFTTRIFDENSGEPQDGTCGGGGIGDGVCNTGLCCSQFGFCGEGDLYCTGQNGLETDATVDEGEEIINNSPLPDDLRPSFGFRCGFTEVDARSNCKPTCTHHIQCLDGEECWGVQLNYCNTFEEGEHPICTDLDLADEDKRCGFDEASARGYCGAKCESNDECGVGEFCFPTLLNLCECHEETCYEEAEIAFAKAKQLISPYFVQTDPGEDANGRPHSASVVLNTSIAKSLLVVFASIGVWMI